jgi:hypothetical protein
MIRISDASDPALFGLSPTFAIVEIPTLTLVSPNGGETWNYGETATVEWTGTNLPDYLYLGYSTDDGQNWYSLGYGYGTETGGSTGVYVPYDPSEEARVREYDPSCEAVSEPARFSRYGIIRRPLSAS